MAVDFELAVLYVSAPTFLSDVAVAEALKKANPRLMVGLVGAHVATLPESSLEASEMVDFIARHEFDYTIVEVAEGKPFDAIDGITYRRDGKIVSNKDRAQIHDMDALPMVTPVYERDLVVEDYFIGYLKYPYMSFYSGRGCRAKCSFCLWPQTIGGNTYRTRSAAKVVEEVAPDEREIPAGAGILLRRRHLHRRPCPGRGNRPRPRQARHHLVLQRPAQRPLRDLESPEGERSAAAAGRL